jgi:hypothetical protein
VARRFAAGGFHVALMSRSLERVEALAQQIVKEGNKATAVPVDVTNAQAVKTAFATVREQLGDPAVLVRDQFGPIAKLGGRCSFKIVCGPAEHQTTPQWYPSFMLPRLRPTLLPWGPLFEMLIWPCASSWKTF